MGPLFVILLWMLMAGIFLLVWSGCLFLFVISLFQKRRWLKALWSIPVGLLTLLPPLVVGTFVYGLGQSMRPSVVFEQAFGMQPPPGVTGVQSKYWFFADTGSIHLRFECSPMQFEEIRPPRLEKVGAELARNAFAGWNQSPPKWWVLPAHDGLLFYGRGLTNIAAGNFFANETELLVYDASAQTAYYRFSGID